MPKNKLNFFNKLRTYTSFISTWFLNLGIFGFQYRNICSYGFNCHGCPWATFACPIGVMAFTSGMGRFFLLPISFILFIGLMLGRLVCSFACPFGFFQDILYKIPTPKIVLPKFTRLIKYAALLGLVFIFPFLFGFKQSEVLLLKDTKVTQNKDNTLNLAVVVENKGKETVTQPWIILNEEDKESKKLSSEITKKFPDIKIEPGQKVELSGITIPDNLDKFNLTVNSPSIEQTPKYEALYYCKLCPTATLTATIPTYFVNNTIVSPPKKHYLRLGILLFFLILMTISSRSFCLTFCPLGAIYALTSRFSLSRIEIDNNKCISCKACNKICPVNLDVINEIGKAECIACGDCKKICPKSAINRKFGL